jgi:hypothetical protein
MSMIKPNPMPRTLATVLLSWFGLAILASSEARADSVSMLINDRTYTCASQDAGASPAAGLIISVGDKFYACAGAGTPFLQPGRPSCACEFSRSEGGFNLYNPALVYRATGTVLFTVDMAYPLFKADCDTFIANSPRCR